jgi:hypothetical protein
VLQRLREERVSVQEAVQAFWMDKARGLLLGQAAADAVASGGGEVMRYGASTTLALAVGEYVGLHGTIDADDIHPLATAMAHAWWTSRDRAGWGLRDAHRFGAALDGDVYPVPREFEHASDGVPAAAVVAPLALMAVGSQVHLLARRCASVLTMDAQERSVATVFASAAALALGGELHRPLDVDRFVRARARCGCRRRRRSRRGASARLRRVAGGRRGGLRSPPRRR